MKPFIVAEMSANHHQSFDRALSIIDSAKEAGASAVKLQSYTPDSMVADRDYVIPTGPWAGKRLYDLYAEAATPMEWHQELFHYCEESDIVCFSTPFDEMSVDMLEYLDCPLYKIASFEIVHLPLIRYVANTGKPMVISTGMASYSEIDKAVDQALKYGCKDLTLLKCTSSYPATALDANLMTMVNMAINFHCKVGVSDHTPGIGVSIAAVTLGASMVEKHLTLDTEDGPDSRFSLLPYDFKQLVKECNAAYEAKGNVSYGPIASEVHSLALRRSIHAVKDIQEGEELTHDNVKLMRPNTGLDHNYLTEIIGKKARQPIKIGTPIKWEMV